MNLELLRVLAMLFVAANEEPAMKEAVIDYLMSSRSITTPSMAKRGWNSTAMLHANLANSPLRSHSLTIGSYQLIRNSNHYDNLLPPTLSQQARVEFERIIQKIDTSLPALGNKTQFLKIPCLPQDATAKQKKFREMDITVGQDAYHYDYESNYRGLPLLKKYNEKLIPQEWPEFDWVVMFAKRLLMIRGDSAIADVKEIIRSRESIVDVVRHINTRTFEQRPRSMNDYATKIFYKAPTANKDYRMDEAFARWRLAGPNAQSLKPCTDEFIRSRVNIDGLTQKWRLRVNAALHDKRLFVCDYTDLATIPTGMGGTHKKYLFGPIALFEIPEDEATRNRQWLAPLAIQIDQMDLRKSKRSPPPVMYTPDDGMHWTIAKMVVQNADAHIHEDVRHLGEAHFFTSPFLIAMHRHLPTEHPLNILLSPHFEGTANINYLSEHSLFSKGGPIGMLHSAQILDLNTYSSKLALEKLSMDFTFPGLVRNRGMDDKMFPAPYPWRDDGMLLWKVIRQWVDEYLRIYYGDDEKTQWARIRGDYELKAWIDELKSENGGRAIWLRSFDGSYRMLVEIVSAIVYTTTAHHATVNMPQVEMVSFVPAFPFALYQPPPDKSRPATEQHLLDMMPPLEMAELQKTTTVIGGIYYNRLGLYRPSHFLDQRVQAPLKRFQDALVQIEKVIEVRNSERVENWRGHMNMDIAKNWAYEYLLPSKIPNSINI